MFFEITTLPALSKVIVMEFLVTLRIPKVLCSSPIQAKHNSSKNVPPSLPRKPRKRSKATLRRFHLLLEISFKILKADDFRNGLIGSVNLPEY